MSVKVLGAPLVGQGGSSVVVAAKVVKRIFQSRRPAAVDANGQVALKVFKAQLFKPEQDVRYPFTSGVATRCSTQFQLLRRELAMARRLQHRHIVPFIGTCTYGLHTVLVSPLMARGNLLRYINEYPKCNRGHFVSIHPSG